MKRFALVVLVVLVGCRKQEAATVAPSGDAGPEPVAPVSAKAAAPPPSAASAAPGKYTFSKQSDWLGRWTLDIPSTFAKTDDHACTDSGCSTHTAFSGDGIRIELDEPLAGDGDPLINAVGVRGGKVTAQKTLPRGFWVAMTAKDNHVFVQQISGFAEPVRLTVTGPLARKTELEALIGSLSSSLVVPTVRPKTYCRQLPWADGGGAGQVTDFDGKLVVGVGLNGKSEDEKPYILQLDPPACDPSGFAAWEAQVYSDGKTPPLASLVGKRVHLAGDFHPQETAHHHRPIMIAVKSIGVL